MPRCQPNLTPLEEAEQTALFDWARMMSGTCPALRLMYAVPNGGLRSRSEAARMQRAGVKAGVPDICLPVARGESHGLYIELKRRQGGRVSDEQTMWMDALRAEGYQCAVCRGWDEAREVLERYLGIAQG